MNAFSKSVSISLNLDIGNFQVKFVNDIYNNVPEFYSLIRI